MYEKDKKVIPLEELDWTELVEMQKEDSSGVGILVKLPGSLNTPYLKKDFDLDLIIWNISDDKVENVKKVVHYVYANFDKLFETGWTLLYHHLCPLDSNVAEHSLEDFFVDQIDFESPYYSVQLEINCDHLEDGEARYCFVVATACGYKKWMISDDDMRMYMVNNKCRSFETNNDDMQIDEYSQEYLYSENKEFGKTAYEKMEEADFQYAIPFEQFEY